jgi:hypothetical protein
VVTKEEAERVASQRATIEANSNAPSNPNAPPLRAGGDVGGYNSFWADAGNRLSQVKGEYRTTWLVEPNTGQLPYTAKGRQLFASQQALTRNNTEGPEVRPMAERCIIGFGSNNHYQIVQTKDNVVFHVEMNHDARIVRLDGKHAPSAVRPWLGDSIGRWDGDTLVVETINFNPGESLRLNFNQSFYISQAAKVTERFTRVSANEILYGFSVDDPDIYTQVWRGEMTMNRVDTHIYEYACHEGNYALPGILAGARAEERAIAKK